MKIQSTIALMSLTLLLLSCNHKDLDFGDQASVAVNFDWSACPEASPEAMRVAVFSDNSQTLFFPFTGSQGGSVGLYKGYTYSFVGYNSDTESIYTNGSEYGTFEFCCMPIELATFSPMFASRRAGETQAPRAMGTESYEMVSEPDPLWYSTAKDVAIRGSQTIEMTMHSAICNYTFKVLNVDNMSNVVNIVATISGFSQSFNPVEGRCSQTYCIMPFEMKATGEHELQGTLRTFGYFPTDAELIDAKKMLVIYVELADSRKLYYTFDVTEDINKVESSPGSTDLEITLKQLPIPKPFYNGNGLHPTVDGWQEVEVSIDL